MGKNLHLVGCATVCGKSEVMLLPSRHHLPRADFAWTCLFLWSFVANRTVHTLLHHSRDYLWLHFWLGLCCHKSEIGGVSSVPFPFWFPFQLHCKLVSSGISSQLVQNILIWCVSWNERPIPALSLLRFSKMISELITFNHLRCHSSSRALVTRTGYWKPTRRGTDEIPQSDFWHLRGKSALILSKLLFCQNSLVISSAT